MWDVIVIGGGTAGVPAAIAAAREGARVLVVESRGFLGGTMTGGCIAYGMDYEGKGGIPLEIKDELIRRGHYKLETPDGPYFLYDIDGMRDVLTQKCAQAGAEVLYGARLVKSEVAGGMIGAVELEVGGERRRLEAAQYIDASGSGELASLSGCEWESGRPGSGEHQPASVAAVLSGVPEDCQFCYTGGQKEKLFALLSSLGRAPSYPSPGMIRLPCGSLWLFGVNHEYGVDPDDEADVAAHYRHGVEEVRLAVEALRTLPGWEMVRLERVSDRLGIRDGRRIRGLYMLTREDLERGARFEDGICTVFQTVDVHTERAEDTEGVRSKPYELPYRALVSAQIGNLLLAGRCVSGDFWAEGSYRVTGDCIAMGEAVGVAASWRRASGAEDALETGRRLKALMRSRGYAFV